MDSTWWTRIVFEAKPRNTADKSGADTIITNYVQHESADVQILQNTRSLQKPSCRGKNNVLGIKQASNQVKISKSEFQCMVYQVAG